MHVCSALHFSSVSIITPMFVMDAVHVSILLLFLKYFLPIRARAGGFATVG